MCIINVIKVLILVNKIFRKMRYLNVSVKNLASDRLILSFLVDTYFIQNIFNLSILVLIMALRIYKQNLFLKNANPKINLPNS